MIYCQDRCVSRAAKEPGRNIYIYISPPPHPYTAYSKRNLFFFPFWLAKFHPSQNVAGRKATLHTGGTGVQSTLTENFLCVCASFVSFSEAVHTEHTFTHNKNMSTQWARHVLASAPRIEWQRSTRCGRTYKLKTQLQITHADNRLHLIRWDNWGAKGRNGNSLSNGPLCCLIFSWWNKETRMTEGRRRGGAWGSPATGWKQGCTATEESSDGVCV